MKTGEKIAKARKIINLTQDQLAELLEVTRQTISKWESELAFPETAKIPKLAEVLKVSCDYLLRDDKSVTTEVSMQSSNGYVVDWTKLYPILGEYQNTVNCKQYHRIFTEMIKEMMKTYNYSLDDTVLVLKDLQYNAFLEMQNENKI
ncbi:helix-turn-helix domain-containing protein [Desulfosporosinus nitroreducens]|uniref:Helix-turn-helix domain-containing protein n=1 Tax=Desulfosporosinus nitroreducens TaxID=2018668 RepID=A0ABT8QT95_9FIRM|nr:helix-turn-helix transcriptional regulator [Desulfosporosinus nitroreducens]MDO0823799.1 helix-turn-helix domain-containing protein [Desulfosporosinus nitroreducens]